MFGFFGNRFRKMNCPCPQLTLKVAEIHGSKIQCVQNLKKKKRSINMTPFVDFFFGSDLDSRLKSTSILFLSFLNRPLTDNHMEKAKGE